MQQTRNRCLSITLCPAKTCVVIFKKWEGCFNAVLFIHIFPFPCQALESMEQVILCFHCGSEKQEHDSSHFPVFNYCSKSKHTISIAELISCQSGYHSGQCSSVRSSTLTSEPIFLMLISLCFLTRQIHSFRSQQKLFIITDTDLTYTKPECV